jgi:hypothetical protein
MKKKIMIVLIIALLALSFTIAEAAKPSTERSDLYVDGSIYVTENAVVGTGTATGENAVAFGSATSAIGDYSIATGFGSQAAADYSTAMGFNTQATGLYSTAIGVGTVYTGHLIASGDYSVAIGNNVQAIGLSSLAMGMYSRAAGESSTAMGYNTFASGPYSTAFGVNTEASGLAAIAMGEGAVASGDYSTALGKRIEAAGEHSMAIALDDQTGTVVTDDNTLAILGGNVVIGDTESMYCATEGCLRVGSDMQVDTHGGYPIRIHGDNGFISRINAVGPDAELYIGAGPTDNLNQIVIYNDSVVIQPPVHFRVDSNIYGGTDVLYYESATGNVGIGTMEPEEKLEVVGNARITNDLFIDTHGGTGITLHGDNGFINRITAGEQGSEFYIEGPGPDIRLDDDSITAYVGNTMGLHYTFAVDSGVEGGSDDQILYYDGNTGDVGIGTDDPEAKLDVDGDTIIRGDLTVEGDLFLGEPVQAASNMKSGVENMKFAADRDFCKEVKFEEAFDQDPVVIITPVTEASEKVPSFSVADIDDDSFSVCCNNALRLCAETTWTVNWIATAN